MAILPGYEYDVFISYRHNDNRSGWVTEFVKSLQEELASTIKESISVYFDTNPHDGLLETHNINKSLEGKLKCLIFIPIISQTYCDPKSFAWQHEFLAFNKLVSEGAPLSSGEGPGVRPDLFGRDIKLSNGNVASRILPVKIHDLDAEDKALLENELGGALRAIDFIYREAGVNRPLKSTDGKSDNLNRTEYRNQVNKVANAIKEIITSLKNPAVQTTRTTINQHPTTKLIRNGKTLIASTALLLLLSIAGYFFYPNPFSSHKGVEILYKSIAVLPFVNMSSNQEQEYFSDGLTEDIITQLAKIKSFKVISRTSVMQYKQNSKSLKEIGKELGVTVLLEGSVQRAGNQLRITAQLINASTDEHLWAESYDRPMKDIFAVQTDIATQIASALRANLSQQERQQIEKQYTANTEAYQLYLQGRFYWNMRLEDPVKKSIEYFKQAIEKDPSYALAYAGLGDSYLMLGVHGFVRPDESFPIANSNTEKALGLDNLLAEAYSTLVDINIHYYWNFDAAEQNFQKAIKVNPNYANAHHWHAEVFLKHKQFEKAFRESQAALEQEPYSPIINAQLGSLYVYAGEFDKAFDQLQRTIGFDSTFALAHYYSGIACLAINNFDKARIHLRRAADLAPGKTNILSGLGYAEALSGNKAEAVRIEKKLQLLSQTKYVSAEDLATIALGLGKNEQSLQYLEQAYQERSPWLPFLSMNPIFSSLKENVKFQALLKKLE